MKNELYHYGIQGMRWGIRRYQNPDGTLTSAGKARYREDGTKITLANMTDDEYEYNMRQMQREKAYNDLKKNRDASSGNTAFDKSDATRIAVGIAATAATVALTAALSDEDSVVTGKDLVKKIVLASGTTAIASVASKYGAKVENVNTTNKNTGSNFKIDANITAKVGKPTNPGTFTAEAEKKYQSLFTPGMSDEDRGLIKGLRKQGFDVDQIEKAISHSNVSGIGWVIQLL